MMREKLRNNLFLTISQRSLANTVKNKIDEEIYQKLDISKFCSTSNIIRIADLGCAAGPNTFVSVQNLI